MNFIDLMKQSDKKNISQSYKYQPEGSQIKTTN